MMFLAEFVNASGVDNAQQLSDLLTSMALTQQLLGMAMGMLLFIAFMATRA
jgi:hypothetical protein